MARRGWRWRGGAGACAERVGVGRQDQRRSSGTRAPSASACSSRSRASTRTRNGVDDRIAIEIIRPSEGRATEGPGDHRPEPVLHDRLPRQRGAVHRGRRRRRRQRQVAAVLRQLLRAARLRGDPRGDERHRQLDGLPDARRPGRHRRREGRSSTGSTAASRATRRRRQHRAVADWHNGKAAMIGKSYNGTLANGVAATGVDGPDDDRADLGDLGLVRLLAHGRHPPQHELPGEPRRNITTTSPDPPGVRCRRLHRTPCATRHRDANVDGDDDRRHQRVLGRPQLPQGRRQGQGVGLRDRTASRTTTSARTRSARGGRARGQRRPAQAVAAARRPHRPVRLPPRRWVDTLHRWFDYWL